MRGKGVRFYLYPDHDETLDAKLVSQRLESRAAELATASFGSAGVWSVGRDPRWSPNLYRDDIHPTVDGFPKPDYRMYESHPVVNSLVLYHAGHGGIGVRATSTTSTATASTSRTAVRARST